jgi:cytochrome c-type biogenesis protein CcmH
VKRSLLVILAGFMILLLVPALASADGDEQLSPEALSIANSLNCPVCQGESVRDSNAQLAHDIRQLIQQKLDQGETRQQIMDYFVSRYGVTILRQPPKHGFSLALWWIPVGAIAIGLLILAGFVTQRQRLATSGAGSAAVEQPSLDDPDLAVWEARIQSDVAAYEEDLLGKIVPPKIEVESSQARVEDLPSRGLAGTDQGIS